MRTTTITRRAIAGVLAVAFVLSPDSAAQDRSVRILDLTFEGGTAAEFVRAIRQAAGDINIVVAPEAAEVAMPPVSLSRVTAAAALNLLEGRSAERPGRVVNLIVRPMPTYDTEERQTYQVRAVVSGSRKAAAAHVWTIAGLLDEIASESILSAVEMALEVVGSTTELDVRFHEDTGLLIAAGDESQLSAIDEVLDQLRGAAADRRNNAVEKLQMKLKAIDTERRSAHDRLGELRSEADALQAEIQAQHQEIARLELLNAQLRRMLDGRDRELAELREELRAMRQRPQQKGSIREPESRR